MQSVSAVIIGVQAVTLGIPLIIAVTLTLRDPRRIKCAIWWGITVNYFLYLLTYYLLASLGAAPTATQGWLFIGLFFGVVLSALVLGTLLVVGGMRLIRREGFGIAHSLALILGVGIFIYFAAVPVAIWSNNEQFFAYLLFLGFPIFYFGFVLVSYLLYAAAYGAWAKRFAPPGKVVVVLGSGLIKDQLTPLLRRRLDLGLIEYEKAYAAGKEPILVVSGGQGADEEVAEATAMGAYVKERGVESVVEESRSTTTEENLRFTADLVGEGARPFMAATSDYHAFRAAVLLRQLKIPGNAVGARTPRYFWASAALREYVALLVEHRVINALMAILTMIPVLTMTYSLLFR